MLSSNVLPDKSLAVSQLSVNILLLFHAHDISTS